VSRPISRRDAIKQMALGAAGAALSLAPRSAAAEALPNFVFILTDDQRWDAMSNMPNSFPFLRTPNIDRLATEGARFENAFVTTSLCSPSRASFLTGCFAHTHGVRTNERNDLDERFPTFPALLQRAGYATAYVGKWHMKPDPSPRPGFDYWLSFAGQGEYVNPSLNENGKNFQAEGYMTDLLTDYAIRWLRRQDGPFCLYLAHKAVHGPFTPAPRHAEAFPDAQIPQPASFQDNMRDKPAWMRRAAVYGAKAEPWHKSQGKPVPDELPAASWDPRNKDRLDYLRTILAVDESVGRVLQTLEQMRQLDNTVVAFASDNGYFLGEHRRGDKRLAYEESIRIPLLIRYPPLVRPGSRPTEMALNIDLAPTILDIAGVQPPKHMQGRSLRPVLEGRAADWRQSWLYEYFQEAWLPGVPTMLAVRTQQFKYVTYPDLQDLDELYDLQNDPMEMKNLAVVPDYHEQAAKMREELERLKKETGYTKAPQVPMVAGARKPRALLILTFDDDDEGRVVDSSSNNNHGQAHAASLVNGRNGKARKFDGTGYISIPKAPSLDPSMTPLTVSAVVKSEKPDGGGVILAHGGQTHGFAMYLDQGHPVFAIRSSGGIHLVRADTPIGADWVELTGVLTNDLSLLLYVDDRKVAEEKADGFIVAQPNEGIEIGQDRGTKVGLYDTDNGFIGLIDEIRIYRGEMLHKSK
jgi:N-acetylglucosamine-6-sulfatase